MGDNRINQKFCVSCEKPCGGAHACRICGKFCHAIMPCSITDGEERFGSDVLCSACWFDDIPTKEETTNSRVENNENQQPEEKNEIFNEEIIQNTDFGNK